MPDERIIRLEENACFMENRLEQLNEQLVIQQQQLDKMERQLGVLQNLVIQLKEEDGQEKTTITGHHELPPHYQNTSWHKD